MYQIQRHQLRHRRLLHQRLNWRFCAPISALTALPQRKIREGSSTLLARLAAAISQRFVMWLRLTTAENLQMAPCLTAATMCSLTCRVLLLAGGRHSLIAPGGSITLYLPPSLAYGSTAVGSIPANSILVFTIDLLAVN